MIEPVRKMWSEDQLREAAMEYMRTDFGLPPDSDKKGQRRYFERLGLLVTFTAWLWDPYTPSSPSDASAEHPCLDSSGGAVDE